MIRSVREITGECHLISSCGRSLKGARVGLITTRGGIMSVILEGMLFGPNQELGDQFYFGCKWKMEECELMYYIKELSRVI